MMNNKCVKGFRKVFKKFASETSMHGFKDLSSSKHVSTTIFWLSVLIFATCMTGIHIAQTMKDFSERKTTMMIQPADKNETILYPPFRICYPHWMHWVSFEKAQQLGFTKDAVLYALAYLSEVYMPKNASFSLCQARRKFLHIMDANKFKNLTQFLLSIRNADRLYFSPSLRSQDSPMLYFESSTLLCEFADEHKIEHILRQHQQEHLESKRMLYTFGIDNKAFRDVQEAVNEDEYYFYMKDYMRQKNEVSYTKGDYNVTMSMTFCPLGYADSRTCFKIENFVRKYFVFITGNVYKWKNKPQSPCAENTIWISPNDTCSFMCKRIVVENRFNSHLMNVPVDKVESLNKQNLKYFENGTSFLINQPDCTIENETKSDVHNKEDRLDSKKELEIAMKRYETCMKSRCVEGCIEYRYSYSMQQETHSSHYETSRIVIQYQQSQDILVMTEEELQTWENFVGNIGGLLGIWTGASILSFIQTIYLCCFTSARMCCKSCHKTGHRDNLQQGAELDIEEDQKINMSHEGDTFEVIIK